MFFALTKHIFSNMRHFFFLLLSFFLAGPLLAQDELEFSPPLQTRFDAPKPLVVRGFQGQAHAGFSGQVQILSMRPYADDWKGILSPVDLAVGWGPMSHRETIDELRITQSNRFYQWTIPTRQMEHWSAEEVILNSANIHMVPGNSTIANRLLTLRPGDKVYIEGYLVDVIRPDNMIWETSLTRYDTGPGACEILLLTNISYIPTQDNFEREPPDASQTPDP